MQRMFARIAALVHRRPIEILSVSAVVLLICAVGLTQIHMATGYNTFINENSDTYQTNHRFQQAFGGDSDFVMATGSRTEMLSPAGLAAQRAAAAELQHNANIKEVISPATVIDLEVQQMAAQAATLQQARAKAEHQAVAAARRATAQAPANVTAAAVVRAKQKADVMFLAKLRVANPRAAALLGLGPISASNPKVVQAIVIPDGKTVNPLLTPLFPDATHTIVQVQLKGNLDLSPQQNANDAVKKAFRQDHPLPGQTLTIAGVPILFGDLVPLLVSNLFTLFGVAFVVMGVVLILVFNVRWRLLPLAVVLGAVVVTFGLMGWVRLDLTMATTAALPILLGLGVDYMVQFHNRYEEEAARESGADVIRRALSHIGPAVGIAVMATILGFLTLLISPVPMVRDFAKVLAGGVVIAYVASVLVLTSILALRDRRQARQTAGSKAAGGRHFVDQALGWLSKTVMPHPMPILIVAVALSTAGWAADSHISTQTDIEKLVPQGISALTSLKQIRAVNGGTSQLDVMVTAPDVAQPAVMAWIARYEAEARANHPAIIGINSPVTLLAAVAGSTAPGPTMTRSLLAGSPAVLRDPVLTHDFRHATIAFTIRQLPLDDVATLVNQLQAEARPPAGVEAALTGTEVVAAKTVSVLSNNRLEITLLGVSAVFLGLLILYRGVRRPLLVVIPMILVISWSSGAMFVLNEPWNPLTVTLGALIIGIGAEFTILLTERYYEERMSGQGPAEAMRQAMGRIGRAITTSGLMVMAGFSALIASDFPALQVFGIVVAVDMAGILIATLVVLPPLVVWLEVSLAERRLMLVPFHS